MSAGIAGDIGVIGADWDDDACPKDPNCSSGSAYVFDLSRFGRLCGGKEKIKKANCKQKGRVNRMTVKLKGGGAADRFAVVLSGGERKTGTVSPKGKGKAKFKKLPPGDGTATAMWGCGALARKDYSCP